MSTTISTNLSMYLSIYLYVYLPICLYAYLCICLSVCPFIDFTTNQPFYLATSLTPYGYINS